MGALEFEPIVPIPNQQSSLLEIDGLVSIAQQILSGRKDFSSNMSASETKAINDIFKIGTSAGGARAKAVIAYNPATSEIRSGQTDVPKGFSHWLLKFDGVSDLNIGNTQGYGRVEMAYHLMARMAEIEMSECRLLEEGERAHFMTRRFDRDEENRKIHYQSFCAMRHYDFNDILSYSYEQLFATMRALLLPYTDAEQMFRRMVFNVMARNCDDHTKNFAFIMTESGEWKLAPAFDVCHAYRPDSTWVSQHSLSINGKRKNIAREDLLQVAEKMNIKKAEQIINQIRSVVGQWKDFAEETRVDSELRDRIQETMWIL
jgi:serine/threonine-protein kinase HipA